MQNLIYDNAAYDILYYDANLEAYRTDRFAGWTKQPEANGTPLFTYSTLAVHQADRRGGGTEPGAVRSAVASSGARPRLAPRAQRRRFRPPHPAGAMAAMRAARAHRSCSAVVALVVVVGVGLFLFRRRRRGRRRRGRRVSEGGPRRPRCSVSDPRSLRHSA